MKLKRKLNKLNHLLKKPLLNREKISKSGSPRLKRKESSLKLAGQEKGVRFKKEHG